MFAAGKTAGASAGTPDAQFNYVTLLLHGDGTNGAQNNTFLDSSTNNFSITRNGNTTQGSFSPYGSNWSNTFSGGSYLTTPSNTDFTFGTGDFTIEFWMNPSSSGQTSTLFSVKGTDYYTDRPIVYQYNERVRLFWYSSGNVVTTDYLIVAGKWQHIAVTRSGSDVRIFYNGVLQQTTTNTTSLDSSTVTIGQSLDGNDWPYAGYISNLRVVKGTALYTSNFTPSTTPLTAVSGTSLLTCQSNRFIDNSASPKTITVGAGTPSVQRFNPFGTATAYSTSVIGGSGYFDGSGDYLTLPSSTALELAYTGQWCMEAWIYPPQDYTPAAWYGGGGDQLGLTATGRSYFIFGPTGFSGAGDAQLFGASITIKGNTWGHVAMTCNGSGLITIYVNGVSAGSASTTKNAYIGKIGYATDTPFTGYMTDARIVKGSQVYTSNFTPPTAPLTAITNTSLLTNMTNAAIFDNAMINDLETVGNAQISTSVVKYGTGSIAFDGTGDSLKGIANSPSFQFGTGDFTIEMWVYTANLSAFQTLLDTRPSDTQSAYGVFINSSAFPSWYDASGFSTSSVAVSSNTWTHVAVSRASGTLRVFVNGTSGFSGSNTNAQNPTGNMVVGMNISGSAPYNGYIDDLRITKGYARYTATFTPPTAAFPNTGPN